MCRRRTRKIGAEIGIEIRAQKVSSHRGKETALQKTNTMTIPDDLLYTESHEWIKREGENIRVGITDHAQSELTDVVYVELPKTRAAGERQRTDRGLSNQ